MPGLCNGSFESRGMSDRIFRHESAVAPTADTKTIRISDLLLDQIVNAVDQILESHPTPIGDCLVHSPTFTRDPASVWQEDNIAIRSQQLSPVPPFAAVPSHPPGSVARMRSDNRRV